MMIRRTTSTILLGLVAIAFVCGCERVEKQDEAESQVMNGILNLLKRYSYERPSVRETNLHQIFENAGEPYPHNWDRRFRAFGKHAGFTNSFFEKYIFFQPGVTNRFVDGEVLLMNAQPYPGLNNQMQRTVVSKRAGGYFRQVLTEGNIQDLFAQNRISPPEPAPMAAPFPAPPNERGDSIKISVSNRIIWFAQRCGMTPDGALAARNVVFYSPLVLVPLLCVWFWRRSRR